MLGLFVYGISLILISFSKSFMQLVIFRVIQGVGLGLFGPAALCLVAQVREKGKGLPYVGRRTALDYWDCLSTGSTIFQECFRC